MLGYKMLRAVSLHEIVKSGHYDAHPDPRFSTIGRKASNVFTVMQIRSVTGDHCTATYTVYTTVMRRDAVPARALSPVIFIPRIREASRIGTGNYHRLSRCISKSRGDQTRLPLGARQSSLLWRLWR